MPLLPPHQPEGHLGCWERTPGTWGAGRQAQGQGHDRTGFRFATGATASSCARSLSLTLALHLSVCLPVCPSLYATHSVFLCVSGHMRMRHGKPAASCSMQLTAAGSCAARVPTRCSKPPPRQGRCLARLCSPCTPSPTTHTHTQTTTSSKQQMKRHALAHAAAAEALARGHSRDGVGAICILAQGLFWCGCWYGWLVVVSILSAS